MKNLFCITFLFIFLSACQPSIQFDSNQRPRKFGSTTSSSVDSTSESEALEELGSSIIECPPDVSPEPGELCVVVCSISDETGNTELVTITLEEVLNSISTENGEKLSMECDEL